jgi:hypothetical protein
LLMETVSCESMIRAVPSAIRDKFDCVKSNFQFQSNEAVKCGITRQVKDLADIP